MHVFSVQNPKNKQLKRWTVVGKIKEKYQWYFSKLKCKKTGAANEITSWTSTQRNKNVFRRKKNKKESTAQDIETFPRNKKRMAYVLNAKRDSES